MECQAEEIKILLSFIVLDDGLFISLQKSVVYCPISYLLTNTDSQDYLFPITQNASESYNPQLVFPKSSS